MWATRLAGNISLQLSAVVPANPGRPYKLDACPRLPEESSV